MRAKLEKGAIVRVDEMMGVGIRQERLREVLMKRVRGRCRDSQRAYILYEKLSSTQIGVARRSTGVCDCAVACAFQRLEPIRCDTILTLEIVRMVRQSTCVASHLPAANAVVAQECVLSQHRIVAELTHTLG